MRARALFSGTYAVLLKTPSSQRRLGPSPSKYLIERWTRFQPPLERRNSGVFRSSLFRTAQGIYKCCAFTPPADPHRLPTSPPAIHVATPAAAKSSEIVAIRCAYPPAPSIADVRSLPSAPAARESGPTHAGFPFRAPRPWWHALHLQLQQ